MLNFKTFKEGIDILCVIFTKEPSEILINTYYLVLKEMSDDQFKNAIAVILKTKKFHAFPLPAELLEAGSEKQEDKTLLAKDKALLALEKVKKAIREVGSYRTVIFDDPVICRVIENFSNGWQGICEMSHDDWKFARKDFLKMYEAFYTNPDGNVPVKLTGRIEHINDITGYHHKSQKTVYIKNTAKDFTRTNQVRQLQVKRKKELIGV